MDSARVCEYCAVLYKIINSRFGFLLLRSVCRVSFKIVARGQSKC